MIRVGSASVSNDVLDGHGQDASSSHGTAIYTWRGTSAEYDTIELKPCRLSREDAYEVAFDSMADDLSITRIYVDFRDGTSIDVSRPLRNAA